MKVIGHIKVFFPTDAFVNLIFHDGNKFYTSEVKDDLIVDFKETKISEDLIVPFKTAENVEIESEKIICFVNGENKKTIWGKKSEVGDELVNLLEDSSIHPLGKCEIAGEYYLNGKITKYLKKYFFDQGNDSNGLTISPTYFLASSYEEIKNGGSMLFDYLKFVSEETKRPYEDFVLTDNETIYIGKRKINVSDYRKSIKRMGKDNEQTNLINLTIERSQNEGRMFKMLSIIKDNKIFKNAATNVTHIIPNQMLNTYLYKYLSEYKGKKDSSFIIQAESRIENQMADLKSNAQMVTTDLNSENYYSLIEMTRGIMKNKEEEIYG